MIRTRGLTKHFTVKDSVVEAVRGIDLDVEEGEVVAVLGPNGAGKTTTLRMLTTLLAPTAGTAVVAGCDVVAQPAEVRRRIGYIGQGNGAGHAQRARDEVVTQGRAYGLGKAESRARADELLTALGLGGLGDRVVQTLSGGQRRRLDVAMGMVHRPRLLFLDEPSTGLDPQNRANLKELVRELHDDHGTTIVLTTHYLDEADSLADRVVVVDHGEVIADGTPRALKGELVGDRMTLGTHDRPDAVRVAAAVDRCADRPGVAVIAPDGMSVTAQVQGAVALLPELLRALDCSGVAVASAEVARATLDDVFLHLTGRSLREDGPSADPSSAPADGSAGLSSPESTRVLQEQAS